MTRKTKLSLFVMLSIKLVLLTNQVIACGENNSLIEIKNLETNLLLNNAPTFKHAWQDKTITLNFNESNSTEINPTHNFCQAAMLLSLPQQDLDEVNAYFDKNPAKLILLNAQGYLIPQQITTLSYQYHIENNIAIPNNDDNQDLKTLHYGIEYMYQLLAQIKVEIKQDASNTLAWSDEDKKSELDKCATKIKFNHVLASNLIESSCNCRVAQLSRIISPQQLELINYIAGQPYSAATGVLTSYQELTQKITDNCKSITK